MFASQITHANNSRYTENSEQKHLQSRQGKYTCSACVTMRVKPLGKQHTRNVKSFNYKGYWNIRVEKSIQTVKNTLITQNCRCVCALCHVFVPCVQGITLGFEKCVFSSSVHRSAYSQLPTATSQYLATCICTFPVRKTS